jgi:uncharacterized membrane protein
MKIELISTGVMGLLLSWATWAIMFYPALFVGIFGLILIIVGFTKK